MILTVMFWLKNTSNEPILHPGSFFFLQTIRKQNFGRKEAKILQFLFLNRATFPRNRIKYAETIDMTDLFYVSKYLLLSEYLIPFNLII